MAIPWRAMVWGQVGGAIDSLEDMIRACPADLWRARLWDGPASAELWYRVYHALFWMDLYLYGSEEGFAPPAPFALVEMRPDDLPERPYTPAELLGYLAELRGRCRATLESLGDEAALRRCAFGWGELSYLELQLYSMRHTQEIAAQLSLFLGQRGVAVPDYVPSARGDASA